MVLGTYLRENGKMIVSRMIPYWLTCVSAAWIVTFLYIWLVDAAYAWYDTVFGSKIFKNFGDEMIVGYGSIMVGLIVPLMSTASIAAFLVTKTPLPAWKFSWANKFFTMIRRFRADDAEYGRHLAKRNQFAKGEANFNLMAIWFVALPSLIGAFGYVPFTIEYAPISAEEHGVSEERMKWVHASAILGWGSIIAMSAFLIPVARHSILLTAMGWSPIHALRIHIWAGYCSFLMAMSHTVTMFVVFWGFDKIPLRDQFIPKAECWAKDANFTLAEGEMHPPPEDDCLWQWWNLTGGFAALFLVILWATSINWVRRKNYRVFYVCHVVFGTLLILATFLHFDFCAIYMLPSTAYYIAATAPSLIQALASRFRGGNKIVKVVALQDAGGCVEFHVATDSEAGKVISTETNLYVKLCVPKNSLIWHPFTVYQHPADHNIVRVLFRPVGPFTKLLSLHLTAPERPVTILDGFYRGSDRVAHSLLHDHVTIIAGGVAITSFLSFVPRLLDAVAMQSKEIRLLNSITLHWAVRETGLEKYILKEFLRVFMAKANVIDGLDFQIKIHCTGRKATAVATEGKDIESSDDGAEPAIAMDETSSGSDSAELIKEGTQAAVVHDIANDTGFAMELARTMPARFTEMQRNIPYAAGFVGFMWLGFHLTFFQYSWNDDINYAGLTKVTWYTILFVVLSVVYGAVVEGGELLYRKYVPAPHADDFIVEQGIKTLDDETNAAVLFDSTKLSKTFGRPTPELLLSEASNSEAPGIFLCGPTALCHDVFKEARKENSFLGLTRYCIYDEPFEM